jgi:uncharacterized membrane protein YccC
MEAAIPEEAKANPGAAFGHTLRRIEKNKINTIWLAFRNSAAVALPLAVGLEFGNPLGSVAVATGALNVSFADGTDPYAQRARRMLGWSVLGAVAVFVGSLAGNHPLAAVLVAMTWAFIAGMLIGISTRAGDLGLNTLVALIVFEARGVSTLEGAFYTGLLVLGGGLLQTLLAVLFWPVRRSAPERRVVGRVFLDLSQEVDPNSDTAPSALTSPHIQEQDALDALGRDHSVTAERFRLLFDQADRLRLSIYALKRLRDELGEGENQRSEAEGDAAADLDSLLALASRSLALTGNSLLSDSAAPDFPGQLNELQKLIERAHEQKRVAAFPLANNIAAATDVLGGQLRLVMQLAQHVTPEGEAEYIKRELKQPFKLQLVGWLATLRANVHPQAAIFRHAVRLALCIGLGDMIERSIGWERAYWLPMTIAVVLKPDFTATFSRGVLRLLGTLGGLALATVLYHLVPDSAFNELLLVGGFTFFLRWLGPANYGVLTIAVSGLVVFLIAILGVSPADVITARGLNTAAGGILALIAYAMWPTWERTQVSEAMACVFDASRLYFRAVMRRLSSDDPDIRRTLDEARREWRRKRSSAEASVDRVSSEPGTLDSTRASLTGMLASSHALVNAIMALEAGTMEADVHTSGAALQTFANDVEFTLYYLAAALRGSPAASRNLPELREDHRRLVEARRNFADQDEYVSIETDRLTVSLNTLREQVTRYLSGGK